MEPVTNPSPFSKPIERPWYLTALAVFLLLWGAGTSVQFLGLTFSALSSGRGPTEILLFFVYMHVLWWALFAAGIGIFLRTSWARPVLVAALVGLFVGTAFQPFAVQGGAIIKAVCYPIIIWLSFTKRSSAYFAGAIAELGPESPKREESGV